MVQPKKLKHATLKANPLSTATDLSDVDMSYVEISSEVSRHPDIFYEEKLLLYRMLCYLKVDIKMINKGVDDHH